VSLDCPYGKQDGVDLLGDKFLDLEPSEAL